MVERAPARLALAALLLRQMSLMVVLVAVAVPETLQGREAQAATADCMVAVVVVAGLDQRED